MVLAEDVLTSSIERLDQWLQSADYAAYDPFDGLNAWLRPVAVGKFGRQVLVQGVKRFPWNLRPLLGIEAATSSKAMGYFARGYLKLYEVARESHWLERSESCLNWLREHTSPYRPGLSWGNHFDYQTRGYYLAKGQPTVVWTALIGHAFVDAYEALGRPTDLETSVQSALFIRDGLERRVEGRGACISYVPTTYLAIHNANMLAAGFLARVYEHTKDETLRQMATDAVSYTVGAQQPDGSWWYGEESKFHWVDNWHTAYVLDSLWWYMQATGDDSMAGDFQAGVRFWLDSFFLEDGTPRYYPDKTYPIDIQCAAQAIESLCLYARAYEPSCLKLADRVALWTISNMQDRKGYFYFQRSSWWVNRTPMLHWGQATMLYALTCLLEAKRNED